jgi:hypothetical protein
VENIKIDLTVFGLDSSGSAKEPVISSCEKGNGVLGFMKGEKFRKIGAYQLLQKIVHEVC